MARLYSDIASAAGRYYYGLTSAPGGVQPAQAEISFRGLAPSVFEQVTVSREPATGRITFSGPSISSEIIIAPAVASISFGGHVPDELRELTVTNALPPDYTELVDLAPQVLFISTLAPQVGAFSFTAPEANVTQGGNIGFVSAAIGGISFQGRAPTVITVSIEVVGAFSFAGQAPTIASELIIMVDHVGLFSMSGNTPRLEIPFTWIDVDPPPATTWTTTTGIAA